MRIADLIYKVLDKTAPMPTKDVTELHGDASKWFTEKLGQATDKQAESKPLNLLDKLLLQSETWYFRTGCAIAYIAIVAYLQRLMNPDNYGIDDHIPEEKRSMFD